LRETGCRADRHRNPRDVAARRKTSRSAVSEIDASWSAERCRSLAVIPPCSTTRCRRIRRAVRRILEVIFALVSKIGERPRGCRDDIADYFSVPIFVVRERAVNLLDADVGLIVEHPKVVSRTMSVRLKAARGLGFRIDSKADRSELHSVIASCPSRRCGVAVRRRDNAPSLRIVRARKRPPEGGGTHRQ